MTMLIPTSQETPSVYPWLSKPPRSYAVRLFCFPHAGGSARMDRSWSGYLTSDIQLCPIELSGRGQRFREVPYRQMKFLVAALGSISKLYLQKLRL